jgi:hypothetical protein
VLFLFALVFAQQMNMPVMSQSKFLSLYFVMVSGICFRNWLYYSGKKRHVLKSKYSGKSYSIIAIWVLPIAFFLLGSFLFQMT